MGILLHNIFIIKFHKGMVVGILIDKNKSNLFEYVKFYFKRVKSYSENF